MSRHLKSIVGPPAALYPWQRAERGVATIGVVDPCYGSSRVIYGLDTERYRHRRVPTLPLRRLDRASTFFRFSPFILDASLPLVHTWNSIPLNRDFIVSFELELPRYLGAPTETEIGRGLRMLDSRRCKRILALSEFAHAFAERRFARHGFPQLAAKMEVFRGAVLDLPEPPAKAQRQSFSAEPLSAVIIGTHLFHKGAMQAIEAFERLRAGGLNVTLTLIGKFETENHFFGEALPDAADWEARARGHDWIRLTGPVPLARVFEELRAHDLCIYTSVGESLGWLPIEAGMLGVPTLATNLCAFPELVRHGETGWLIDVPVDEDRRLAGLEPPGPAKLAALADFRERTVDGIIECVCAIHDDPGLLARWGPAARRHLDGLYGMTAASRRLEAIYDEVLAGMGRMAPAPLTAGRASPAA